MVLLRQGREITGIGGTQVAEKIEFTSNYRDMSTDKGFQYEFYCDRCGSGFRTGFKPSAIGAVTGALEAASSLFSGLYRARDLSEHVRSAGWQKAHDEAFIAAVSEVKADFKQCPKCQRWVCKKCWNERRGLCKECAPDLGVEMSAAQSSKAVEAVWTNATASEEDAQATTADHFRENIVATCPKCGAPLAGNAKFCPNCGANLKQSGFCSQCGTKLAPGAKFCPECGTPAAQTDQ